ncbi:MAG: stage III sporulation protein AG [Bacillota bacterium]|nr:stage III sporulation protein AG [Bacillota bacterium]
MGQFDKLKEFFQNLVNGKNKKKIIENSIIAIIIGIIIIIAGSSLFGGGSKKQAATLTDAKNTVTETPTAATVSDEKQYLEKELESILSQIAGAGKVSVMITYDSGKESVPAVDVKKSDNDTQEKDTSGGTRDINQSNYESSIAYEEAQGGSKKPIILKELEPKVKGVIIISDGADDPQVREELCSAAQVSLDVPVYKIQVYQRSK